MRGVHALLYVVIRNPAVLNPLGRPNGWRWEGSPATVFRRSTIWGPRPGHSVAEIDSLIAASEALRQEFVRRSGPDPVVSADLEHPLNVDWVNRTETEKAAIANRLCEVGMPVGEAFGILVAPTGDAKNGSHLFVFPGTFYVDILNATVPDDLRRLNEQVWRWLDPAQVHDLIEVEWRPNMGVDPWEEGWSWFGEWDVFQREQAKLQRLMDAWLANHWSVAESELLARELRDKTDLVPLDEEHWITMDWQADDFQANNRWTGTGRPGTTAHEYKRRLVDVRLINGAWGLPYVELDTSLRQAAMPGRCPSCERLTGREPGARRHRDHLCDMCGVERKRAASRVRSRRYRASHHP